MPKDEVLARADADLARGLIHPAMQRLASLTAAYPDDLNIRARRAALNRQVGNLAEAGRWGYLTEDVTADEIAAFERAQRSGWARLSMLRLRSDPTQHLGPSARQRFVTLVEQASADGRGSVSWTDAGPRPETRRDGVPCLIAVLVGMALAGLVIVGLVTVVQWIRS